MPEHADESPEIAASSCATPSAASARSPSARSCAGSRARRRAEPARAQGAAPRRPRRSRDLPVHGRRAQPPGHVRPQAAAEQAQRPAAPGRVRRGQVPVRADRRQAARHQAHLPNATARAASRSPTCSRTPPSASTTSPSSGRATATWWSTPRPSTSCSPGGSCRASRAWARGSSTASARRAQSLPGYVVMPDPHGALEAGQPMYSNGFLPAVYQPTMFRPGDRPVLQPRPAAGRRRRPTRRKTLDSICDAEPARH